MEPVTLSVLIPAHNPHRGRLQRVLAALRAQTLGVDRWEIILVDNASTPALDPGDLQPGAPEARLVRESRLGLTQARRKGMAEARGRLLVFVDDDNVLHAEYLAHVARLFEAHAQVGAMGGRSLPEFEVAPPAWMSEFFPLLALRDLGNEARISGKPGVGNPSYPVDCAPMGAGMAMRREAVAAWLASSDDGLSDRRGRELTSAGDNDLVFAVLRAGFQVGYFPELSLTHLIPRERLDPDYLARLNRGIQKSWMQVLTRHEANPWPPIPAWSVAPRKLKAWFAYRAWSGAAARIRWQGACGHFEGRAEGRASG